MNAAPRRRIPLPLVVASVLLAGVAALILVAWFFPNTGLFVLSNLVGFFVLLVLGVLGGAFVGMLVAHRVVSQQEFTPFERTVLESLTELRNDVEAIRAAQRALEENHSPADPGNPAAPAQRAREK